MIIDSIDLDEIKKQIVEFTKGHTVYICGVSALGKTFADWMDKANIDYKGFVDQKGFANWTEKRVYRYEELRNFDLESGRFIITQKLFKTEVKQSLEGAGVPKENILLFFDDVTFDCFHYDLISDIKTTNMVSSEFRNKYKGKRCFVIGNGPSLTENDLLRVKDEYTFSVNMMYENFERLHWKPTFYFVNDRAMSSIFENDDEVFLRTVNGVDWFFAECKTGLFLKYADKTPDNMVFYKDISQRKKQNEQYDFSDDMEKGVYRGQTVLFDVLQAAAYFGFEEIYLLGVDMNYARSISKTGDRVINDKVKENHATFIREPAEYSNDAYERVDCMLLGYEAAARYASDRAIKIYNATRGGKLDTFTRIDFDSLFK